MIEPKLSVKMLERSPLDRSDRLGKIRLDRNERTIPFSAEVWQRFQELMIQETVMAYPQTERVYQLLSDYVGVPEECLTLASGSDLCIRSVFEAYISKGDRIVVSNPGYAMYKVYGRMFEAIIAEVEVESDLSFKPDSFIAAMAPDTRAVVIEFPNGFTGTSMSRECMVGLVEEAQSRGILMVIDEAYAAFNGDSLVDLIHEYDNLLITRSCSKDLGAAGLRIGYTVSNREIADILRRVRPMHEVTSASACFITAALEHPDDIKNYVETVSSNRRYTLRKLSEMGFDTAGGRGNFILVHFGDKKKLEQAIADLSNEAILVRRPFDSEKMNGWMRVGIGSKDEMDLFLSVLKSL